MDNSKEERSRNVYGNATRNTEIPEKPACTSKCVCGADQPRNLGIDKGTQTWSFEPVLKPGTPYVSPWSNTVILPKKIDSTENRTSWRGRPLQGLEPRKIFLRNLLVSSDENALEEYFSQFGVVLNTTVNRYEDCITSLETGYVEFEEADSVKRVFAYKGPHMVDGREVAVFHFNPPTRVGTNWRK